MMGNFYPPVIFEVKAIAGEALASFGAINKQLKVMEAQAVKTGRALTTMNKAAIVGTKVLKGLGIAFAAFAAIGVKEVIDLEKSFTRLGKAMANVGVSTEENRTKTAELVESYEKLGFGAERAADAYSVLITATGDIDKSNKLLATSADLARARNIGLEESAKLLVRAQRGNARLFTQFGIELDKTLPKAQAVEKAMADLSSRLGGQALAYTKTFAGQLEVLQENLKDVAEAIGGRILPFLNRFLGALNNTGSWIKKNNDLAIALAVTITVLLIPAVVQLTKKLLALALTILRSPLVRMAVLIGLIAYQFVKAYNASEDFRQRVADVAKDVLGIVQWMINVFENLTQAIQFPEKAIIKLGLAWAKFRGDEKKQAEWQRELNAWENSYRKIDTWSNSLDNAKKKIDEFAKKKLKLDLKGFLPSIPGFDNGTFNGVSEGLDAAVKKALDSARQRFKDFARDVADSFKEIGNQFNRIVGKDFNAIIELRLSDQVTQFKAAISDALGVYQQAMARYTQATSALAGAQAQFTAAIISGNDALIASAESALRYAENAVNEASSGMSDALKNIEQIQEDIINAVVEARREVQRLEKERTKVLEDAQEERLRLEKDYNKQVERLRKDYDKSVISAEADAAKRRAEIIKSSIDQMRSAFKSATYKTLSSVYESLTYEGRYLKGGSMEKILKNLGMQTQKAKTLAGNAAELAGLGFSQTFIEEVLSLGPDMGNSLASTILNSTPESIEQLKTYWEELQRTSSHGVDDIATQLNSGLTLATEELTQQLADVQTELDATLASLNLDLQENLQEAFNSYSEALDEVNQRTAETIAEIDAQISELNKTILELLKLLEELKNIPKPTSGGGLRLPIPTEEEIIPHDDSHQATGTYPSSTKYTVKPGDTLSSIAKAYGTSLSQILADNPKFTEVDKYKGGNMIWAGTTVNISVDATSNTTSQQIANDIGWAFRTSSDVNYAGGL